MTKPDPLFDPHSPKMNDAETLRHYLEKLSRGASHDVNNVFTYIMGMAEIAQLHSDVPEPIQSALEKIITYVERGRHLTQQIMDFGNSFQNTISEVNLRKFMGTYKSDLSLWVAPDQKITMEVSETIGFVYVDETQLKKLLRHICMNAIESMEESDQKVKNLSLSVREVNENEVEFKVSDTGIGVKEKDFPEVFTPFFSRKKTIKHAGLGLSIAQQICMIHGGNIGIDNNDSGGSTVKITLPIRTNSHL